jgi:hypothetical protein
MAAAVPEVVLLDGEVVVARLAPGAPVPTGVLDGDPGPLTCVVRTGEELSVVCARGRAPDGARVEGPWRVLRVAGTLEFGLTGVLHGLTGPLAAAGISVFAVSTFDTDYVLVPAADAARAVAALAARQLSA